MLLTQRYALGLYQVASARKELPRLVDQVRVWREVWERCAPLQAYVEDPRVVTTEKIGVITRLVGPVMAPLLLAFFRLVLQHHRQALWPAILQAFHALHQEREHQLPLHLLSAHRLTPAQEERCLALARAWVPDSALVLVREIRPELLGGFIIRLGSRQLDMSVRKRFLQCKHQWQALCSASSPV